MDYNESENEENSGKILEYKNTRNFSENSEVYFSVHVFVVVQKLCRTKIYFAALPQNKDRHLDTNEVLYNSGIFSEISDRNAHHLGRDSRLYSVTHVIFPGTSG
jgi:hypothetical protein